MRFQSLGRSRHPILESAADLEAALTLPDALWVCNAVPVATLRGDPVFYGHLDADKDGRVRSDELRAAISWTLAHLRERGGLGSSALTASAIDPSGPDSAALLSAAQRLSEGSVTLEATRAALKAERESGLSTAGLLLPVAAGEDAELMALLEAAIRVTGGVAHPSGQRAADKAGVQAALDAAKARVGWLDAGAAACEARGPSMPLGEATEAAWRAVEAVAAKVDQLFVLGDALALEPALEAHMGVDLEGVDLLDAEQARALLRRAPLTPPRAPATLTLDGPLNPAWRPEVERLFEAAVQPLLGDTRGLDRAGWTQLRAALAPHAEWRAKEPVSIEVTEDRLRGWLSDGALPARVDALLAASEREAEITRGLELLEQLLLYQAHLLRFANNMIATPELMSADTSGLMEQGRLVLDGREFDLSVKVLDPARAERFGAMSPIYTMFVMVGAKGGQWTGQLAVPVTAGERGHLVEGQWGVFFPVEGEVQHAQIRKIASSPISIREALLAPFRRVGAMLESAADKAAASSGADMDKALSAKTSQAADMATGSAQRAVVAGEQAKVAGAGAAAGPTSGSGPTSGPPGAAGASLAPPAASGAAPSAPADPAQAAPAGGLSGVAGQLPLLIAGAGIALAALASAGAYVLDVLWGAAGSLAAGLLSLDVMQSLSPAALRAAQLLALPVAALIIGLGLLLVPFLLYAVPVSIATWIRLRKRDLSTLLEGAGWAMNARLMLERDHAARLTRRPPE